MKKLPNIAFNQYSSLVVDLIDQLPTIDFIIVDIEILLAHQ